MYAPYFGLRQAPFSLAPDPRYLYMSERHREALAHLVYGLGGAGGGFVLLSGEIGAGKTTVCHCFIEQIPPGCNVAYIFNPKLDADELLQTVCDEFGLGAAADAGRAAPTAADAGPADAQAAAAATRAAGAEAGAETSADGDADARPRPPLVHASPKQLTDRLNTFLLRAHAAGQNNILIIDEAQKLSGDVLEQLRLLTNLETNERKLLQIVLIGQPELRELLARPELEQLAQRVVARFHLGALSADETRHYVQHRLDVAGLAGASPFEPAALQRVHRISRGVPRRINLLCDRALLGAYATGSARVTARIVDQAAREVFGASPRAAGWRARAPALAAGALGGAALVAGGALMLRAGADQATAGAPVAAAATAGPAGTRGPAAGAKAAAATAMPPAATVTAAAPASDAPRPAASAQPSPRDATTGAAGLTARAAAPGAAGSAAASSPAAADPADPAQPAFKALIRSEPQAWRALAPAWRVELPEAGDPCAAAQRHQLHCFRGSTSLTVIRQLDRPGFVTLFDNNGRPAYALLTGLAGDTATLKVGNDERRVALSALAAMWRGDFATLWRAPPGYGSDTADTGRWVSERLARLQGRPQPLKAGVAAFQLAQGLKPDGVAGPITLMQINRATGVDEPRLAGGS